MKNLGNFKLFVTKRAFFSKTKVFKHFWKPFPFPVAKFHNFLLKSARFFIKLRFLSIFGPYFRFLWPIFKTFCHKAREALKILKNQLPLPFVFFSNFAIFGPHFHQLFATKRVKPWKILKFWNFWLPFPFFFLAILPFLDPIFTNFLPKY